MIMKNLKPQVLEYLESEARFRERKNKDRGLVNLLIKKYPVLEGIDKSIMVDMVQDYNSMDRCWRKILEERHDLRGSDYGMKDELEQEAQRQLGYNI